MKVKLTDICGCQLLAHTADEVLEIITDRVKSRQGAWVLTMNLEMVARGKRDPAYGRMICTADFILADGMPLVWASRKKHGVHPIPERVTGSDLSERLLRALPPEECAIIGGTDPAKALELIDLPGRERIFIDNGKIGIDEDSAKKLAQELSGRHMVFIALGVPKQDHLAKKLHELLPEAVIIGVGGTFELMANLKPRAPIWMQRSGLEWLFRLSAEPGRLWRRYLIEYWGGGFALLFDIRKSKRDKSASP